MTLSTPSDRCAARRGLLGPALIGAMLVPHRDHPGRRHQGRSRAAATRMEVVRARGRPQPADQRRVLDYWTPPDGRRPADRLLGIVTKGAAC